MRGCCAINSYLHSIYNGETTNLSVRVFRTLAASDVKSISIYKQCEFLDSILHSEFTEEFLKNPNLSLRDLKKRIMYADFSRSLEVAFNHASQYYVAEIAKSNAWLKFWDKSLDYGVDGTRASLAILRILCATAFFG